MPPKVTKPKKGGLREEQIQPTVDVVKQYWPQYQITTASIKNPNRAFVLKLYTDCVQNLDAKLAFATRTQPLPFPPGLCEEEQLYIKLSQIPALAEADFKLGDLYVYDPVRVNSHIQIIMHFLMFTETVMDKTVAICTAVFDAREKKEQYEQELTILKEDKLKKQIELTKAKADKKKLKEEAAKIAPEYEYAMTQIEEMEKKCKNKIVEMEKIKGELENIEEEIQKLEKTESHLRSQIVTEAEYSDLKATLESLEREDENLEENDHSNGKGLVEQKQYMEHLQMCLRELNRLELNEAIFKLSNSRCQLKDAEESWQYTLSIQKNSDSGLNSLKSQLENDKQSIEAVKKELEEQLRLLTEAGMLMESKIKKKYQKMERSNRIKIMEQERTLEKLEVDHVRLQRELKEKYEAVCKTQDMALERFKLFMNKVNKALAERKTE